LLEIKPQWVTLEGWETFPVSWSSGGMTKLSTFKQPVFGVTSFETKAVVKDGETILFGSCSTPDGESIQIGFLTTRLRGVNSDPSDSRRDKSRLQNELKNAAVFKKLKSVVVPEMSSHLPPSTTIIDAVRSLKDASIHYDSGVPEMERGVNFALKVPTSFWEQNKTQSLTNVDIFAEPESDTNGVPYIPRSICRIFTLDDTLKLVCDMTGMEFEIKDGIVWISPASCNSNKMITRFYPLSPPLREQGSPGFSVIGNDESVRHLKGFFKTDALWPPGSSFGYLTDFDVLRVTNVYTNLACLEQLLEDNDDLYDLMAEADLQIHAFPVEEIEQLRRSGNISVEQLMILRKNGKSKSVASATVLQKLATESDVKAVREVIYPTEFLPDIDQAGSNAIVHAATQTLVPGCFEMREIGLILQIIAEASYPDPSTTPDPSKFDVTLKMSWVTLDGWETNLVDRVEGSSHSKIPFKQPIFGVKSFEMQTTVKDGETVLLGGSATTDNKWVQFGFLTIKKKRHYTGAQLRM
jgi:hypothetical protein